MEDMKSLIAWSLFQRRLEMAPRIFRASGNKPHQGEREMMRRRVQITMEGGKTYYGVPIWEGK
jgi:hypothetical protein